MSRPVSVVCTSIIIAEQSALGPWVLHHLLLSGATTLGRVYGCCRAGATRAGPGVVCFLLRTRGELGGWYVADRPLITLRAVGRRRWGWSVSGSPL